MKNNAPIMEPHEILSQYPAFERNQNQEIYLSESPEPTPSEKTEAPTSAWLISGVWGAVIVTGVLLSFKRISTRRRKQRDTDNWNRHQYIPCYNCRFASRNPHLKCAVHPAKAMKQAAIGCSDYWATDSDQFSQSFNRANDS